MGKNSQWSNTAAIPMLAQTRRLLSVAARERGKRKIVVDWRERYHTKKTKMENAPPISFSSTDLTARRRHRLAVPVRERKSLIALNVAHSLLTGEKLFDHFAVVKKPSRVLYLCPEVSLGPFTDRLRKIGLMDYVGETLFCRNSSAQGHVDLDDLKRRAAGAAW